MQQREGNSVSEAEGAGLGTFGMTKGAETEGRHLEQKSCGASADVRWVPKIGG